jgi:hypothetical protein
MRAGRAPQSQSKVADEKFMGSFIQSLFTDKHLRCVCPALWVDRVCGLGQIEQRGATTIKRLEMLGTGPSYNDEPALDCRAAALGPLEQLIERIAKNKKGKKSGHPARKTVKMELVKIRDDPKITHRLWYRPKYCLDSKSASQFITFPALCEAW